MITAGLSTFVARRVVQAGGLVLDGPLLAVFVERTTELGPTVGPRRVAVAGLREPAVQAVHDRLGVHPVKLRRQGQSREHVFRWQPAATVVEDQVPPMLHLLVLGQRDVKG